MHRHRGKDTYIHRHRNRLTSGQVGRLADWQRNMQTYSKPDEHTHTGRQRETEKQRDRLRTRRGKYTGTDKHTQTLTKTHSLIHRATNLQPCIHTNTAIH